MKKITIALVMLISVMSFAQGNAELKAHYEAYYKQMKNQGDVQGVINAMTHLDILTPSQARRDTLAYLYVSEGKYIQALNTIGIEKNTHEYGIHKAVDAMYEINNPIVAIENDNICFANIFS